MQIEHDPNEPQIDRSNLIFYVNWGILALAATALLLGGYEFDWPSAAFGGYAIALLIITVNEKTDGKSPWR